jgi:hypothetical protein
VHLQDTADDTVKRHYGWLPTDVKARKIALLTMYMVNSLFSEVNKALYDNDRQLLWSNAGYIRELRDVFLVGQTLPIVEPFVKGIVCRSMALEEDQLQALAEQYDRGQMVCWASFTSTSDVNSSEERTDGNVIFRIHCGKMGSPMSGEYYPALVKAFSSFPTQEEVIFPPHCPLCIVNIEILEGCITVDMETMECQGVWKLIENQDWKSFSAWAACNGELVNTRLRKFSMIGAIAENISKPLVEGHPDPFAVCLGCGADINELHHQETPLGIVESKLARASGADEKRMYQAWASRLREHGARTGR